MKTEFENAFKLIMDKLEIWYELAVKSLPNLVVAFAVLFIFAFLAKLAKQAGGKIVGRGQTSKAVVGLFESSLYLVTLVAGVFVALSILNLDKAVVSLLAGAGVIGLALGFAFQEIASNFVAGVFIAFRQPYRIGDIVEVTGYKGVVEKINLRTTSMITFDGIEIFLPNKAMFTQPLKNFTSAPIRRLDLSVGVSYSDDLEKVEKLTHNVLKNMENRVSDRDPEVFFKNFGSSSIDFDARVWIKYNSEIDYLKARHKLVKDIKSEFDNNDITIPFPIRTLDFQKDQTEMIVSKLKN